MDKPLTVEYAKEIGTAFIQTYYQSFDNGPRENLSALYVNKHKTFTRQSIRRWIRNFLLRFIYD